MRGSNLLRWGMQNYQGSLRSSRNLISPRNTFGCLFRNMNVHFSSKTPEWETPQDTFDALHKEFHLTRDVCATRENTKLPAYWDKEKDGLKQDWSKSRCWMNPPYGREVGRWIKKAATGGAEIVVALLPSRTDTRWFHDYIYNKAEIRFLKGRLKFGGQKNSAPFPSMIVIFKS